MNVYVPGQTVNISAQFYNTSTGLPITVTTVILRVMAPGSETDYTVGFSNPSPGAYSYNITVYTPGIWTYRWVATAPFFAANKSSFKVEDPAPFLINIAAGDY